jgi:hypothetical protein
MKIINSLSGGKTSSYMAVHYPADYNIFALVTIEDATCQPSDKELIKYVSDKIGKEFIATAEDDATLYAMRDLEHLIGREITWVAGNSFEVVNRKATGGNGLPNIMWRFCTTELKMRPIFDWWFKNINEKVQMNIGIRYDEMERADNIRNSFKGIVGKRGTRNKWEEIEWREASFPLIEDKVIHPRVVKWAKESGLSFPSDSNCVGCFHKPLQQLRKNWDDNPKKMQWFADQESQTKKWKKEMNYDHIKNLPLQSEFDFGTGAGCSSGFCTN